MRKLFLSAMAFAAMMSAISLTSCSNDDDNTGNGDGNGGDPSEMVELKGIIEGTTTLDANKVYHLTGTVTVPEGATLQIPAGTKIKAAKGFDKYILVAQGGKIEARGTADRPIVFTADSEDATSGYWGRTHHQRQSTHFRRHRRPDGRYRDRQQPAVRRH